MLTLQPKPNIKILIITVGNEAPAPPLIASAVVPMPQSSAKYLKNNIKTYVTISTRSLGGHSDVTLLKLNIIQQPYCIS